MSSGLAAQSVAAGAVVLIVAVAMLRQGSRPVETAPEAREVPERDSVLGVDLSELRRLHPDLTGPHAARPPREDLVEYRAERPDGSGMTVTLRDGEVEHVQHIFRRRASTEEADDLLRRFGKGQRWEHSPHQTGAFDDWVREDGEVFVRRFNGGDSYTEFQISSREYREWIAGN